MDEQTIAIMKNKGHRAAIENSKSINALSEEQVRWLMKNDHRAKTQSVCKGRLRAINKNRRYDEQLALAVEHVRKGNTIGSADALFDVSYRSIKKAMTGEEYNTSNRGYKSKKIFKQKQFIAKRLSNYLWNKELKIKPEFFEDISDYDTY